MTEIVRTCIDRQVLGPEDPDGILSKEREKLARETLPPLPSAYEAAGVKDKLWAVGRVLHVRFLDGDAAVRKKVEAVAHTWSGCANIAFAFDDDPNAEIRISFQQPGSWSYIGTDALLIARNAPTMNFGWLTPTTDDEEYSRVVLHEFGHALGLIHEHQNPGQGGIPWNRQAVLDYYMGPPNRWTVAQVETNILSTYNKELIRYTDFDDHSIMLYPVPKEHTLGGFEVPWQNSQLSETDKKFIGELYPFTS